MEWYAYLQELVSTPGVSKESLVEANRLMHQLESNIVPSVAALRRLRKAQEAAKTCGRLRSDGACAWLRKHSREAGLPPPMPGKAVLCHRRGSGPSDSLYSGCIGYTKGGKLR